MAKERLWKSISRHRRVKPDYLRGRDTICNRYASAYFSDWHVKSGHQL
jgi:hypothetical protein